MGRFQCGIVVWQFAISGKANRSGLARSISILYAFGSRMTAAEIINEIKHLSRTEQAEVACFLHDLEKAEMLTPKELGQLAGKLAGTSDPVEAQKLKEEILSGFYGTKKDA
jgi:hypothetical protein